MRVQDSSLPQVDPKEVAVILSLAEKCLVKEGDFVEFGCYRGDTSVELAKIMIDGRSANFVKENNRVDKRLWLYDSFAGLPDKTAEDQSVAGDQFQAGELPATKRALLERFRRANLPQPIVRKGFFEELNPDRDVPEKIAFAFLDGDLYRSIRTSLQIVWPRVSSGATIVVHDYNNPELPGVARAVDEFMRAHHSQSFSTRHTLAIITK